MGTGKSTWLAQSILRGNKRCVVVLPRIKELKRYEELLRPIEGLVSLSDDTGQGKKDRFIEALKDAQVILITHVLYEEHLSFDTFDMIKEGRWELIMDEVVAAFEPIRLVTGTELAGFMSMDVMRKVPIIDEVAQLEVNHKTLPWYLGLPAGEASANQKQMVKDAVVKDVLVVLNKDDDAMVWPTFSLNENRLNAFVDVTVLTYPFKNTDLDYWLQIKGYDVDHLRLTRVSSNNALEDFIVTKHDGRYSGRAFRDLIEIVGVDKSAKTNSYGNRPNHFSATEYKRLRSPSNKMKEEIHIIQQVLRREFRNKHHKSKFVAPDDFMLICPADQEATWRDSKNGLPDAFIGKSTWLAFNERATNDHAGKHNMAFLYNVYPFMEVEKIVEAFGLEYNQRQYALYILIQCVWRSAIRRGEKIRLYLPSKRMRDVLLSWLEAPME